MARKGNPILVILELELLILLVGFTITLFFLWLGIPIVPIACCDDGDGQTDSPPDDVVDMGAPRSPPTAIPNLSSKSRLGQRPEPCSH